MRKLIARIFKNGHDDDDGDSDVDDESKPSTLEQAQDGADAALESLRTLTREIKAVDPDSSGPMPVAS